MAENKRAEDVAERAENAAEKKEADKFTKEQRAAIGAAGRTIVSASAGSGKTTVMIEKILRLIISGTDVKEILAVTFTNKAAAQMKDKLRREIIRAINRKDTSPEQRARLREQLADVPGADISTIHSFCSRLIRSHFFAAGVDGSFSVIGSDDAAGSELRSKALDELFEEAYDEGEEKFLRLLSVYWRKKSDNNLRKILLSLYDKLRERADYREFMQNFLPFTEEKFDRIAAALFSMLREKCDYYAALAEKEEEYFRAVGRTKSEKNAKTVAGALRAIAGEPDYFSACALPAKSGFSIPRKESAKKDDSEEDTLHMARLAKICDSVKKDIFEDCAKVRSRAEELDDYLRSGEIAECLVEYLLRLDDRLWELKRERGVLDYNDLEHVALSLLSQPAVAEEMKAKYKYVFVDEYQDVNPVQEKILSAVSGENVFLVGDVKQSIYGFRGSKSEFFVRKQREFEGTEGASSLFLTRNFRSADAVLDAVNSQFLRAMTNETAGIDYAAGSVMERGGRYETNSGRVQVHIWKDEEKKEAERGVYSVVDSYLAGRKKLSEYGARVRRLIERERNREFFDPDTGKRRRAEYSDIAVLSRKKGGRIAEVIGALTEEGIPVASVAAVNICKYPEVETLIDILSLIDDEEQDIPLCSALLSAMGGLTAEDLARIRLACPDRGEDERAPRNFRDCCRAYAAEQKDEIAFKLNRFYGYLKKLRTLSAVQDAGELLVGLLAETNMEARLLSRDNGEECLRRIHRFIAEASEPEPLSVHAFLDRLRALGYDVEYSENGGGKFRESADHARFQRAGISRRHPGRPQRAFSRGGQGRSAPRRGIRHRPPLLSPRIDGKEPYAAHAAVRQTAGCGGGQRRDEPLLCRPHPRQVRPAPDLFRRARHARREICQVVCRFRRFFRLGKISRRRGGDRAAQTGKIGARRQGGSGIVKGDRAGVFVEIPVRGRRRSAREEFRFRRPERVVRRAPRLFGRVFFRPRTLSRRGRPGDRNGVPCLSRTLFFARGAFGGVCPRGIGKAGGGGGAFAGDARAHRRKTAPENSRPARVFRTLRHAPVQGTEISRLPARGGGLAGQAGGLRKGRCALPGRARPSGGFRRGDPHRRL